MMGTFKIHTDKPFDRAHVDARNHLAVLVEHQYLPG